MEMSQLRAPQRDSTPLLLSSASLFDLSIIHATNLDPALFYFAVFDILPPPKDGKV